jgi:DNA polymerase-1
MTKSFFIIDGTALAYRSYFAFIRNPLISAKGENVSAVYGFTMSLIKLIREDKPDYIAMTFDSKEPTFRHEMYNEYKATREKMPDDMIDSLSRIDQVVEALRIHSCVAPGYEADDIMGTFAQKAFDAGLNVFIVTGDKDLMQLVNDRISWYNLKKSGQDTEILDPDGVRNKFGVLPGKVVDVLGLMGDSSDNVPGVPGIGPKTAVKLIEEYSSLENVYDSIDTIEKTSLKEKLIENKDLAYLSKELVTIKRDVPVPFDLESFALREPDIETALPLFRELEFTSLVKQLAPSVKATPQERNYSSVTTLAELEKLVENLSNNDFVFDLETTGLDTIIAEVVGFSFSWRGTEAFYLPVTAPGLSLPFTRNEIMQKLKPVLENASIKKCAHNAKYDTMVLDKYGITVKGLKFDTMIAGYLLDPDERQYGLDAQSLKFLNIAKIPTSDLIGKGKEQKNMADVPLDQIAEYACEDADCTYQLWKFFEPRLKEKKLEKLFADIELPLIPVLAGMELTGITIDAGFLTSLSEKMHTMMDQLAKEIHIEAGEEFNIGSPQQLGKILFEKLEIQKEFGIKRVKKTKIGYSTDVSVLEQYQGHPVVRQILDYRQHAKLLSTYIDALPKLIKEKTGRIHTSFNQTVAATGRLSSMNPNLQNIPVRTELGREIRKAFIPKDMSWSLLSADYSQIELRLMADMSGDENMRQAFVNGEDIHARTAALVFGVEDSDVKPEMRYRAKAINFGILYGMSPYRLARELDISNGEAQEFITAYFSYFPDVNVFIQKIIGQAYTDGYVETKFGRRRYLPLLHSDNQHVRRNAENIAINTPLQGTAAEIIKLAMIRIDESLAKEKLWAKMLMQIHDELVFESPEDEIDKLKKIVRSCMEGTVKLSVPLVVDIHTGSNWYEAH